MKVTAQTRYLKISAQKLRQAADVARDRQAGDAMDTLRVTNLKAAGLVYDTLKSAMANAENNHNLNARGMVIDEIRVDQGPKLKRYRPRSRGMTHKIYHPMAHLTIVLDEAVKPVPAKPAAPQAAQSTGSGVTKPKSPTTNPTNQTKEAK